jgi:hypothetical protein
VQTLEAMDADPIVQILREAAAWGRELRQKRIAVKQTDEAHPGKVSTSSADGKDRSQNDRA